MEIKKTFLKIFSPWVWGSFLLMALITVGLAWGGMEALDVYTHHGQKIAVPNVEGQQVQDAVYKMERLGLRPLIVDSVYIRNRPAGAVMAQVPNGGDTVKQGRYIYLTVNTGVVPTVTLPDIADNSSERTAQMKLKMLGLKLAPSEYIDGEEGWVYAVKYKGREMTSGDKVPYDAIITLVVGSGGLTQNDSTELPTMNLPQGSANEEENETNEQEGVDDIFQ